MNKRIPLWWKFRIQIFRSGDGFAVQFLCGIVYSVLRWNYTPGFPYYDKESGVDIGYIPWRCREGQIMPAKQFRWVSKRYSEFAP